MFLFSKSLIFLSAVTEKKTNFFDQQHRLLKLDSPLSRSELERCSFASDFCLSFQAFKAAQQGVFVLFIRTALSLSGSSTADPDVGVSLVGSNNHKH